MSLPPIALTIAGSDPSGGAGIQADLKTFSALHVYGMSVVTAITAQNSTGVGQVFELPADALTEQIDAVMSDALPGAVKVGMLSSVQNVRIVAQKLAQYSGPRVVLDPVMTATSGARLLAPEAREWMRRELLPLAVLVTPNLDEAEDLLGMPVRSVVQMEAAARGIHSLGARHVLIKGGHLKGGEAVDVFWDGRSVVRLVGERIEGPDARGTGCVLSAAVAAYLARGNSLLDAVKAAKRFTRDALRNRLDVGRGRGPCDPLGLSPES